MNNASVPMYQRMMMQIIHEIEAGILKENDKLPSEQQLGEIFSISRITVRKALEELQFRHFIYKKRGQGSFVLSRKQRNKYYKYLDIKEKINEMNLMPRSEINKFNIIADKRYSKVKENMDLSSTDYIYEIEKTYFGDRERIMFSHCFIDYARFPEIKIDELENEEILPILYGKYDLVPDSIDTSSTAAIIKKNDQEYLDANVGDPKVIRKVEVIENKKIVLSEVSEVVGFLPMYL
ncbi:GntR family transcriptional regulator [Lactobacillus hamsteri]|uniref:Transcription regulator n=1 Tax=Lactobacillus hamsteri DSM 5661 = JCM 6256 TaxID=1423754 RepID=A0A0R1YBP0_9LACO|nr:GntR family transcriptional regulator [Lactobacillus hamsteri]KRM39928.1 transcription regulator [Lactobacillus hamsteri DSM 5661 = JCM 6256]